MTRTHPVHDAGTLRTARRNDVPARTHAERIDAPSIHLGDEGVRGVANVSNKLIRIPVTGNP